MIVRDPDMGKHLWFVLTDPDADRGWQVLVMLVTKREHSDRTLLLDVGDHPFIRHRSAVAFGTARYFPGSKLVEALASGRATAADDMSADLLARVRVGLLASAYTPNDIATYCRSKFPP